MLQELRQQHQQIRERCAGLDRMLAQRECPDLDRLESARWAIVTATLQHLAVEDRRVFLPLFDHSDPHVVAAARSHREALDSLFERYQAHFKAWPNDRIAREWIAYRLQMTSLLMVLTDMIATEEHSLFPHVAIAPASPRLRRISDRNWAAEAIQLKGLMR